MCSYFYIDFIDFMFKCKSLADFINLISLKDFEKKDKITLDFIFYLKFNIWMKLMCTSLNKFIFN